MTRLKIGAETTMPRTMPRRAQCSTARLAIFTRARPNVRFPVVLPTRTGDEEALVRHQGKTVAAVVISRLPGESPASTDLTPALRHELGRVVGRLSLALADFHHPGAQSA